MSELEENRQKLFTACKSGDKCLLIKTAKAGITPSAYDTIDNEGKSPLHIACRYGHINIVRMLVEVYGCSPKAVDNTCSTPIHDACYYDQVVILDYLIHTCSNPQKILLDIDLKGNTPFHKANQSGSSHVIKYILHTLLTESTPQKLSLDIDFDLVSSRGSRNVRYFNITNNVGDTPFAVACRHGHITIMKMYIYCHNHLGRRVYFPVNIKSLLKTANQCGQFEIAYYLQSTYVSQNSTSSKVGMRRYFDDMYEQYYYSDDSECHYCLKRKNVCYHGIKHININVRSIYWNIVTLDSEIESFCMAILHGNNDFVNKFHTLQESKFHDADGVDVCLAACVADNVDIVKQYLSSNMVPMFNGNTLLHIACEWGSKIVAQYIITTAKCDINATNSIGETPVHTACRHRKVEIIKLFLNAGQCDDVLFNKFSVLSETPLHLACSHTDSTIANLILDIGQRLNLDVDTPDQYGDTPLMNACRSGNVHLVERLVGMGCNPFYINKISKEMPIHVACRMQRLDILKIIVNSIEGEINHRNRFGETPLCIALDASCLDIVKFIVERGLCDVTLSLRISAHDPDFQSKNHSDNVVSNSGRSTPESLIAYEDGALLHRVEYDRPMSGDLRIPLEHPSYISHPTSDNALHLPHNQHHHITPFNLPTGDNAVHFACRTNDVKLLQLLLNHCPASVEVVNSLGDTPLHVAARNGNVSMMECLIASCKFPLDSIVNNDGNSVLHLACKRGTLNVVNFLLVNCSLTLKNKDGNTPIHIACYKKSALLVGCLLEKCKGNLDKHRNNKNDTFLHIAAKVGDVDTISLLLKHCSTTCQNSDGDTPIHIACTVNNQSVVECLLENNNSTYPFANKNGQTYLHAACNKMAKLDIVKTIFNKGYKTLGNCPDKGGDIPLHYACRSGQPDIVEYLMTDDRCDPYRFNNEGLSPLYYALSRNDFHLINSVINKGFCDVNQPVKTGSPMLHCLIELTEEWDNRYGWRNYEDLVEHDEFEFPHSHYEGSSSVLLQRFLKILARKKGIIDLNATNSEGNTALHLVCMSEQYVNARVLLSTDAVGQSLSHRNHDDKSPIQLTRNYDIIRLLISYGANPEDVYDRFASILERSKEQQPLEPAVKVIVLGNATAGKTTLVKVLKSNDKDVLQVEGSTAGIETSIHNSKEFGRVTFHDFAGQPEFESSHSAFLERCSSSIQPPLFLLVVDANQLQYIERRIHNWLSFIQNHCTCSSNTPPHVIVIGSHVDEVILIQLSHTKDTFVKAIKNFKSSEFECFDPVFLDCRKADTKDMKTLRSKLKKSCLKLKQFVEVDCRCHILFANLLKWFPTDKVVKVKDLLHCIKESIESTSDYPTMRRRAYTVAARRHIRSLTYSSNSDSSEFLLPVYVQPLFDLLKSLHTGGHILLLEGETEEDSWIVMNQDALFKSVNGILFAPKDFEHHLELESNTGVVPLTILQKLFPDLDFGMVKQFLILHEFCHKIEDNETLKLIHGSNELMDKMKSSTHNIYYFFPGFVQSEKPMNVWDTPKESPYSFSCGWTLQCQSKQFFDTRFLHVLLLRLTFTFVACISEISMFKRQCNIWKNGIHWGTRNGVEVMVELREDKTLLLVLVRCFKDQELEAIKLRTAVLKKIWETKCEFCLKVNVDEYLLHPNCLSNTSLQGHEIYQVSIKEIAQTVIDGKPCVICPSNNKPLPLDTLLYYEPYSRMDKEHVRLFFTKENTNDTISSEILYSLSAFLHPVYQHLIKVLNIPETELGFHRDKWRDQPVQLLHHLFESWRSRREKPTFQTLRSEFDEYSIFFGRDPQV